MMILHDIVQDDGRSVILVSHDPRVEEVANRTLRLKDESLRDRRRRNPHGPSHSVYGMRAET